MLIARLLNLFGIQQPENAIDYFRFGLMRIRYVIATNPKANPPRNMRLYPIPAETEKRFDVLWREIQDE